MDLLDFQLTGAKGSQGEPIVHWLQSLKQFFLNLILCLGASLIYILIASLILVALF